MAGEKIKNIVVELKNHAPFTLFGALTGIVLMLLFRNVEHQTAQRLFSIFHPSHVILSAMVTASLFKLHEKKKNFLIVLVVGYLGSIGIATMSDSVIPFFGESILGVSIPSHVAIHHPSHDTDTDYKHEANLHKQEHHSTAKETERHEQRKHRVHFGFIEDWYIVNPAAILGVLIAYFWPRTKFPHAGHVLLSTWASSFHVLMNTYQDITVTMLIGIFIVLFIAVWLPCCISDIVFPLLFVKAER